MDTQHQENAPRVQETNLASSFRNPGTTYYGIPVPEQLLRYDVQQSEVFPSSATNDTHHIRAGNTQLRVVTGINTGTPTSTPNTQIQAGIVPTLASPASVPFSIRPEYREENPEQPKEKPREVLDFSHMTTHLPRRIIPPTQREVLDYNDIRGDLPAIHNAQHLHMLADTISEYGGTVQPQDLSAIPRIVDNSEADENTLYRLKHPGIFRPGLTNLPQPENPEDRSEQTDMWAYFRDTAPAPQLTRDSVVNLGLKNVDLLDVHNALRDTYCRKILEPTFYDFDARELETHVASMYRHVIERRQQAQQDESLDVNVLDPKWMCYGKPYRLNILPVDPDEKTEPIPWRYGLTPATMYLNYFKSFTYYIRMYVCYVASVNPLMMDNNYLNTYTSMLTYDIDGKAVTILMLCPEYMYDAIKKLERHVIIFKNLKIGNGIAQDDPRIPLLKYELKNSSMVILWGDADIFLYGAVYDKNPEITTQPNKTRSGDIVGTYNNVVRYAKIHDWVHTCADALPATVYWNTTIVDAAPETMAGIFDFNDVVQVTENVLAPLFTSRVETNFTILGYPAPPISALKPREDRVSYAIMGINVTPDNQYKFRCWDMFNDKPEKQLANETFVVRLYNEIKNANRDLSLGLFFNILARTKLEKGKQSEVMPSVFTWHMEVSHYVPLENLNRDMINRFDWLKTIVDNHANIPASSEWRNNPTVDNSAYITATDVSIISNITTYGYRFAAKQVKVFIKVFDTMITGVSIPRNITIDNSSPAASRMELFFVVCTACKKIMHKDLEIRGRMVCGHNGCQVQYTVLDTEPPNIPKWGPELIESGIVIPVWNISFMFGKLFCKCSSNYTIHLMTGVVNVCHYIQMCKQEGRFTYAYCVDPVHDPIIRGISAFLAQRQRLDVTFEVKIHPEDRNFGPKMATIGERCKENFVPAGNSPCYIAVKTVTLNRSRVNFNNWPPDSLMFPSNLSKENLDAPVNKFYLKREIYFGYPILTALECKYYAERGVVLTEYMVEAYRRWSIKMCRGDMTKAEEEVDKLRTFYETCQNLRYIDTDAMFTLPGKKDEKYNKNSNAAAESTENQDEILNEMNNPGGEDHPIDAINEQIELEFNAGTIAEQDTPL
jgi:hypothetical protein